VSYSSNVDEVASVGVSYWAPTRTSNGTRHRAASMTGLGDRSSITVVDIFNLQIAATMTVTAGIMTLNDILYSHSTTCMTATARQHHS
jgi:hypothetical protein